MRLSGRTVELNICAQITQNYHKKVFWFDLTRKQDAKAGFDTAISLGGRVVLFQFKVSDQVLPGGERRFPLERNQLQKLSQIVHQYKRSIFYVFPLIGNTWELYRAKGDLYSHTWLLDISDMPEVPEAPAPIFNLRSNRKYHADVLPLMLKITPDLPYCRLISLNDLIMKSFDSSVGLNHFLFGEQLVQQPSGDVPFQNIDFNKAYSLLAPFRKNFRMAVIVE